MLTLLKQEFFKSWKQNRIYIWLIIALIVPFITLKISPSVQSVPSFAGGASLASLYALVAMAITFTQEFHFGTIRPLLSRRFSRGMVFTSKLLTVFLNYLLMLLVSFIATQIAQLIFVHDSTKEIRTQVWQVTGTMLIDNILNMLFVTGLVLLISNIVKSSGAAIGLGMVMLVGTGILSAASSFLIAMWEPFKWNPFQLLQVIDYFGTSGSSMSILDMQVQQAYSTGLWAIFTVFGLYIVLIYVIAYYIFRKRSV
ncbi:ABC transporter permease subunit [Lactobacillaceae bacterium L1_55_11]|nr:ABC transporter permease subunit [Lactobacillaceae bacterium L1_55_11]